jgi:beta-glucosidase
MTNHRIHGWPAAAIVAAMAMATSCSGPKAKNVEECALEQSANLPCASQDPDVDRAVRLLRSMTLEEKVQQMSGPFTESANMFEQDDNLRLGIPGLMYMDGPRGVRWWNSDWGTTVYPVGSARGSSWDLELERRIGKGMAKEMRLLGRHILLAPTINQVSHPRWGRAQESYGEDAFLLGEMGAHFVRGAQHQPSVLDALDPTWPVTDSYRVMANAKHFAANNIENTRIEVNAQVDERTLHEVYLPHFKRLVDEGVASVMSSYNRVNGKYAGYSTELLRNVLKTEWKFQGFVVSDWNAKGNSVESPPAGLDIEMPFSGDSCPYMFHCDRFYGHHLVEKVASGAVDVKWVDEAALRILYAKVKFGVLDYPEAWEPFDAIGDDTQALALQSAREGMVLLKNGPSKILSDDVLPLPRSAALTKITMIGRFSREENMGDKGSSDAKVTIPQKVIVPYEGLVAGWPAANASESSCSDVSAGGNCALRFNTFAGNEAKVEGSQVIVVVAGYSGATLNPGTGGEEGEWNDRVSMELPQRDLANLTAAIAYKNTHAGVKLVVVLKSGGSIVVNPWAADADAIVMAWFGGMLEGTALAEILFGDVNPSGKVVQSFPARESDLPAFENATTGTVVYGYYHGYRWLDKQPATTPTYYFGHGLSYTTFGYSNLRVLTPTAAEDGEITVKVDVTNDGPVTGSEVVQAYVGYSHTSVNDSIGRPVKELKGFARAADIAPGETREVTITIRAADLAYRDVASHSMKVEKMPHELYVGPSSNPADLTLTSTFTIE